VGDQVSAFSYENRSPFRALAANMKKNARVQFWLSIIDALPCSALPPVRYTCFSLCRRRRDGAGGCTWCWKLRRRRWRRKKCPSGGDGGSSRKPRDGNIGV
jgi:hypothetical protein